MERMEQVRHTLDTTILDVILDFITTEPGMMEYVAETILLARSSPEYKKLLEKVMAMDNKDVPWSGEDDPKLTLMWSFGFLAGASCAVRAVDEGLITDSDEDSEDEGGDFEC